MHEVRSFGPRAATAWRVLASLVDNIINEKGKLWYRDGPVAYLDQSGCFKEALDASELGRVA